LKNISKRSLGSISELKDCLMNGEEKSEAVVASDLSEDVRSGPTISYLLLLSASDNTPKASPMTGQTEHFSEKRTKKKRKQTFESFVGSLLAVLVRVILKGHLQDEQVTVVSKSKRKLMKEEGGPCDKPS